MVQTGQLFLETGQCQMAADMAPPCVDICCVGVASGLLRNAPGGGMKHSVLSEQNSL